MKSHHPITLFIVRQLAFVLRILLSLRYRVIIRGSEHLINCSPSLILPNHQALIDPLILFSWMYRYNTAIPVITSDFYDLSILQPIFQNWGAVRVSNLEKGNRDTLLLNNIVQSVNRGFLLKKNIVLYPSGQLSGQGYEKIFNKKSAHSIVYAMPEGVSVLGVRISGLWGSMWSKAWTGKTPHFFTQLIRGVVYILLNLIFFLPRRKVTLEFFNITNQAIDMSKKGQKPFNDFLEELYNRNGEENVLYLKHFFYLPECKRRLPTRIIGSVKMESEGLIQQSGNDISKETFYLVRTIVASVLKIDFQSIRPESNLKMDLGADSLNVIEILSEVENHFKSFRSPEILSMKTVADLCRVATGNFSCEYGLKPSFRNSSNIRVNPISVKSDKNILDHFIETFSTHPGVDFAYDAIGGLSQRGNFLMKASILAQLIHSKVKGKHVGIMLPALQSTTLLIAATYIAGKIPVMLNWTVGKKVLEHCTESIGLQVILTSGSFIEKIEDHLPDSMKPKLIFIEQEIPFISWVLKLKGLVQSTFPRCFLLHKSIDETAVILFTSGSESLPKAVPLTHHNIISNLNSVFRMIEITDDHIFLGFLPPFHSFGFTVLAILPLVSGVRVAYTPNPTDAREVLKILKHSAANVLIGTPGFLQLLMNNGSEYYFKSITHVISGAEAMPSTMKDQFLKLNSHAILLEGYGITECSPILSINPMDKQKINSVGKFLPGIEYLILNPDTGQLVEPGQVGMIHVRGKSVFNGYLDKAIDSPFVQMNEKSYYRTGDLGYVDEDGYLFITGRLKRFLKVAGEMISLPFLETILIREYGKQESHVLAVEGTDKSYPPQIVLFTSLKLELDEVNQVLLSNGVAPIAKIRRIMHLDEIPVLGTGKTDYKQLRKLIE